MRVLPAALTLAATVLTVAMSPTPAAACTCAAQLPLQHYERADAVFTGRLVRIDKAPRGLAYRSIDPVSYDFAVERALKGAVAAQTSVGSVAGGESCGLEGMRVGERYTVFARFENGGLRSGLCSGTRQGDPDPTIAYFSGALLPVEADRPGLAALALAAVGVALAVLLVGGPTRFGRMWRGRGPGVIALLGGGVAFGLLHLYAVRGLTDIHPILWLAVLASVALATGAVARHRAGLIAGGAFLIGTALWIALALRPSTWPWQPNDVWGWQQWASTGLTLLPTLLGSILFGALGGRIARRSTAPRP